MSKPIIGTLVETYFRTRGITDLHGTGNLRFHPRCYYRPDDHGPLETWPAMIAAVTDLNGTITAAHRTWLAPDGTGKAPVETQRKAMGDLLGHAVRFGAPGEVMAAGEGIESVLSVRQAMPDMAMAAALSAAHLAAILYPETLRRLYVIRDNDPAGDGARDSLVERANAVGIEVIVLSPVWRTSTKISGTLASMHSGPISGANSHHRTSPASWRRRHNRQGGKWRGHRQMPAWMPLHRKRAAPRPSRGRSAHRRAGAAMAAPTIFRRRPQKRKWAAFPSRNKIVGLSPSSAHASALRFAAGAVPSRPCASSP